MNYYERALELKDETIANRRHIHKNAETGLDLPKTKAYVMKKLTEYGLEPKDCGYGVTATLGKGGKVLLLRADIDYGFAEADTTYGKTGVKVWIYRGEILPTKAAKEGSDK